MNLIGEHIDYAGFPVLPMALTREVRILFRPRTDARVQVSNLDPRFPEEAFEIGLEIPRAEAGGWGNYLRAAGQAVARDYGLVRGMDALVHADLPDSAGLSSSSALVVAAALALLASGEAGASALESASGRLLLAEILAAGERYTGTQGGGMDQAVSLLAREGHACRIEFEPLAVRHLPIPDDWSFVVAHSGHSARKSGPEQGAYNRRRSEVEAALSHDSEDPPPPELARRLRHVTTEAARVEAACRALAEQDADAFGRAMTASHASLRDDFEVSTPALDSMVEAALEAGAPGARLTGAGFGGCAVALASPSTAGRVLAAMVSVAAGEGSRSPPAFLARPGGGASVGPL